MNIRSMLWSRAALPLVGLSAATPIAAAGCLGQVESTDDEEIGSALQADTSVSLQMLDPVCQGAGQQVLHSAGFPEHLPGPCEPVAPDEAIDAANALCGPNALKYYTYHCSDLTWPPPAAHAWTVYAECCAPAVPSCSDGVQNQGEASIDCGGPCAPCSTSLICKDASFQPVIPCGLPENGTGLGSYGTGSARGRLVVPDQAGASQTMTLTAQGLQPNTWYLFGLHDPTGAHQFSANGAHCLFGIKQGPGGFEWCDSALVKTDADGKLSKLVPTDSSLVGGSCAPDGQAGCVTLLQPGPNLGHGAYHGLTAGLANVGAGADGTTPKISVLVVGGTTQLFEQSALPPFTAP